MMDIKDAEKVIQNLQNRPFICGANEIVLDNGYIILKKEEYERLTEECRAAAEKQNARPLEEKVNPDFPHMGKMHYCVCGTAYLEKGAKYCGNCGQRLG